MVRNVAIAISSILIIGFIVGPVRERVAGYLAKHTWQVSQERFSENALPEDLDATDFSVRFEDNNLNQAETGYLAADEAPSPINHSQAYRDQKNKIGLAEDDAALPMSGNKSQLHDDIIGYRSKSRKMIKDIQIVLAQSGYYEGKIDGKIGPQTKKAIKNFQRDRNLSPNGALEDRTLQELKKMSAQY